MSLTIIKDKDKSKTHASSENKIINEVFVFIYLLLNCIALYCIAPYRIALHCTAQYDDIIVSESARSYVYPVRACFYFFQPLIFDHILFDCFPTCLHF